MTDGFAPPASARAASEEDEAGGPRLTPTTASGDKRWPEAALPQAVRTKRPFWKRCDDTPYPLEYTVQGLLASCGGGGGYWAD